MRCEFYGGPHDGEQHEVGHPLPAEVLLPVAVTPALNTSRRVDAALDVHPIGTLTYLRAEHAITGDPIYVLRELIRRSLGLR